MKVKIEKTNDQFEKYEFRIESYKGRSSLESAKFSQIFQNQCIIGFMYHHQAKPMLKMVHFFSWKFLHKLKVTNSHFPQILIFRFEHQICKKNDDSLLYFKYCLFSNHPAALLFVIRVIWIFFSCEQSFHLIQSCLKFEKIELELNWTSRQFEVQFSSYNPD